MCGRFAAQLPPEFTRRSFTSKTEVPSLDHVRRVKTSQGERILMRVTALALITGFAALHASAQSRSKALLFAARLEQSRTTLQVDRTGLHGPGAAVLSGAVAQARYVLIGEDHLSREIPQFATSICRLMVPTGLHAFAVEVGPEAAQVVNENLRRPDRARRIAAFMQAHPDAMAFQNSQDESDMAAQCAVLAGAHFQIWGLDQEFFGASGYLLDEMLAAHPGPGARAAIQNLALIDGPATAAAIASGSPNDLFVFTVTDRQMADAKTAIERDGGDRVNRLFGALAETRAIYVSQESNGFASNGQRARLLKRTLVKYLEASPKGGRVLFKFGDVHMAKGFNALGQRDLGNFVAERADGEGTSSLHIAVYGADGIHAAYGGVGRQVRHEPFVLTDDADYVWLKDALALRDAAGAGRDWLLIDLRPLRSRPPSDMSPQWRQEVQEYDLVAVAPALTPSMLMGAK